MILFTNFYLINIVYNSYNSYLARCKAFNSSWFLFLSMSCCFFKCFLFIISKSSSTVFSGLKDLCWKVNYHLRYNSTVIPYNLMKWSFYCSGLLTFDMLMMSWLLTLWKSIHTLLSFNSNYKTSNYHFKWWIWITTTYGSNLSNVKYRIFRPSRTVKINEKK